MQWTLDGIYLPVNKICELVKVMQVGFEVQSEFPPSAEALVGTIATVETERAEFVRLAHPTQEMLMTFGGEKTHAQGCSGVRRREQ
jgi:hypothetical protein